MKCFVCEETLEELDVVYNTNVNLPVCSHCSGSEEETKRASELLEGLADGFVCGCI
jgi:hypothetical protein